MRPYGAFMEFALEFIEGLNYCIGRSSHGSMGR